MRVTGAGCGEVASQSVGFAGIDVVDSVVVGDRAAQRIATVDELHFVDAQIIGNGAARIDLQGRCPVGLGQPARAQRIGVIQPQHARREDGPAAVRVGGRKEQSSAARLGQDRRATHDSRVGHDKPFTHRDGRVGGDLDTNVAVQAEIVGRAERAAVEGHLVDKVATRILAKIPSIADGKRRTEIVHGSTDARRMGNGEQ